MSFQSEIIPGWLAIARAWAGVPTARAIGSWCRTNKAASPRLVRYALSEAVGWWSYVTTNFTCEAPLLIAFARSGSMNVVDAALTGWIAPEYRGVESIIRADSMAKR